MSALLSLRKSITRNTLHPEHGSHSERAPVWVSRDRSTQPGRSITRNTPDLTLRAGAPPRSTDGPPDPPDDIVARTLSQKGRFIRPFAVSGVWKNTMTEEADPL